MSRIERQKRRVGESPWISRKPHKESFEPLTISGNSFERNQQCELLVNNFRLHWLSIVLLERVGVRTLNLNIQDEYSYQLN